ncbi:MAG TPA: glycosyltransferase family 2 protein [Hyphomicrobium sp.]|nr:glycosyltransferase family 2 protein [Hyphomicrobium sp.]
MRHELITVVIPIFNEARNLDRLFQRLLPVLERLDVRWELLCVDDGSVDDSLGKLKELNSLDRRVRAISLSRNFGQEIALAAGLKYARGDAVILMDADLQHPPELLETFIEEWRNGWQIVFGQRIDAAAGRPRSRRLSSKLYYGLFNALAKVKLPEGSGDFRLLDRRAVDAMNRLGESARFSKGLYSWIGFRTLGIPYTVSERTDGASRWKLRKLARLAIDGITSFSTVPLRVWSLLGVMISAAAFIYGLVVLFQTLAFGRDSPGFATLIISILFLAGIQLISLGVVGEYLGRVFEEVKGRPLFIVADEIGIAPSHQADERVVTIGGEHRAHL